jgi:hypothetical protein
MKTFKEHSTYANLPVLTEEEFEELMLIITEAYDPEGYYDRLKKHLGEKLGPLLGKGSSRAAHAAGDITIKLRHYNQDGSAYTVRDHVVPVVHKIALKHYTSYDSVRRPHEMMLGQMQNLNEAHPHFDHMRTYIKHEDGTYSANPHGILPTVFDSHPEGLYLLSERVKPITYESFHKITGIHMGDMRDFLGERHKHARRGLSPTQKGISIVDHQYHRPHNLTDDHPVVESFKEAVDNGIHPGDINKDNTGITINHPHGPKVVFADSGFMQPHGYVPGLYNTVKKYSDREELKDAADRAKRRLGIKT